MKAYVDKNICTGCGLCIDTSPTVFKMENYVAIIIKDPIPEKEYVSSKNAAEQCPVDAIKIIE